MSFCSLHWLESFQPELLLVTYKYQIYTYVWLGHRRAFDHFLGPLNVFLIIVLDSLLTKFRALLVQFRLDLAPILHILLDLLQGGASLLIVPFFCHLETYRWLIGFQP